MIRRCVSVLINLAIAALVFSIWLIEARRRGGLLLPSGSGRVSMRYFTTLSNLFQGFASLLYAAFVAAALIRRRGAIPHAVALIKYMSTVCVTLTFLTALLYLTPASRDFSGTMLHGTNKFFHLLVPLIAAADIMLFDREGPLSLPDSAIAVAPVLLYGVCYWVNIAVNGVGYGSRSNDWYGFLNKGSAWAPAIYASFLLVTWLIALAERLPRRMP